MRRWMAALLVVVLVFGLAAPAFAVAKKPVFVSHPYTAKQTYKVDVSINTWGYVAPKASDLTSRTIEIMVYKRGKRGKYTFVSSFEGELHNAAKFKHSTRYSAVVSLGVVGQYRMRARYGWKGAGDLMVYKSGSYKYFRIK